ncbi:MAG TPA: hypothetical protein PKO06_18920 [Candidatus Ozemobacteraceae bacterium]|nr:hypothetical protein [Candidatus Ozemobacteraceae bacterium]
MLEKTLKVVLGLMLMVLYLQRVVMPGIDDLRRERQQLAALQASVSRFRGGEQRERARMGMQQAMMRDHMTQLGRLIPGFDETRTSLQAKFEAIKTAVPGIWSVKPAPSFTDDAAVVRWPFKVVFDGELPAALKAISLIENSGQLARISNLQFSAQPRGRVRVEADLELLYQRQAAVSLAAAPSTEGRP